MGLKDYDEKITYKKNKFVWGRYFINRNTILRILFIGSWCLTNLLDFFKTIDVEGRDRSEIIRFCTATDSLVQA